VILIEDLVPPLAVLGVHLTHGELVNPAGGLFPLPDDTRVCPGHGPQTTIGQEKRSNPFL